MVPEGRRGQRWGANQGLGRIEPLGAVIVAPPPARRAGTPCDCGGEVRGGRGARGVRGSAELNW